MLGPRFADDGRPTLVLSGTQAAARESIDRKIREGHYCFEPVSCPTCGGSRFERLAEKDRCGVRSPTVICVECGLVQANPRLTADAYREYYAAEYRNLQHGGEPGAEVFAQERRRGEAIVSYVEAALSRSVRGLRVVEVGGGSGGALAAFQARGAEVYGVDLASGFVEYGRGQGLPLRCGTLQEAPPPWPADLVVYCHSFEHVLAPLDELDVVRGVLAPGGTLYLQVPGIKRLDTYEWDFLRYLQNAHTYHFSLTSLGDLVGRRGFELVAGDETIEALFRMGPPTARPWRGDVAAVRASLDAAEGRRWRALPRALLRRLLVATGLWDWTAALRRRRRA